VCLFALLRIFRRILKKLARRGQLEGFHFLGAWTFDTGSHFESESVLNYTPPHKICDADTHSNTLLTRGLRSFMAPRVWRALLGLTLLTASGYARADARDPAAADLLFSAGREAFEAGDYAAACSKFEESHRLDPAPGTLMNLGACNEKLGRLAVAWEHWREALRLLGKDDERYARLEARLRALEVRVPKLEVSMAAEAPANTQITRDGVPLRGPSLGVALPVNPGEHIIEATAPGHAKRRYKLELEEGKVVTLLVEPGALLPLQSEPERKSVVADKAPVKSADGASRKQLGFIIGGVGLVGLGVAGTTGLLALQKKGVVNDECDKQGTSYLCNDEGMSAASSGSTFATISTVSAIVGGSALIVGGYLVLSSNSSSPHALLLRSRVNTSGAALELARSF
jgi:hypothetical protein